jgi:poly(3-hydroxybutyrate) depolymerase
MKAKSPYLLTCLLILGCYCSVIGTAQAKEPPQEPQYRRSSGCGVAQKGTGTFTSMKIRILEQDRTYLLRVPNTYDSNRAYPIVFRWHGAGGSGESGGLGIEFSAGNDAIVVAADGLNNGWSGHSDSTDLLLDANYADYLFSSDPVDLIFFDRMLDTIEKRYCIDRERIFSYGFSAGASFSNLLACERGHVLRANATIAGWRRGGNCKGKVANWFLHDIDDKVVSIEKGKAARDRVLAINGCLATPVIDSLVCVQYEGCSMAPVIWCETKGFGHNIRSDFAPEVVWRFFQSLR